VSAGDGWLTDTRVSYDTVAQSYADQVRGYPDNAPYDRAVFALFAELVCANGGGPVVDVGCGPGHVTAHLRRCGVEVLGVDLSPGMIAVARGDHPGVRFVVGSMTDLGLAGASVTGLVAWYSLIHVPDADVGAVLAQFRRVVRPGGLLLLGFHAGDGSRLKTDGYGGHPMRVHVHRRPPDRVAAWLADAGFTVEAQLTLGAVEGRPAGILFARRP
jgi:SAM-dependent methyltransferase